MQRYHIKIYTRPEDIKAVKTLTDRLNALKWTYTEHCIDNIKYRAVNMIEILNFIKGQTLNSKEVFEYYIENNTLTKLCYRIPFNKEIDLILVVSNIKNLITVYINTNNDKHYTLNRELYAKE